MNCRSDLPSAQDGQTGKNVSRDYETHASLMSIVFWFVVGAVGLILTGGPWQAVVGLAGAVLTVSAYAGFLRR